MNLLTVTQIAERWGKSRQLVFRYIQQGRLPAQMLGNQYVITLSDLEAFERLPRPTGRPHRSWQKDQC